MSQDLNVSLEEAANIFRGFVDPTSTIVAALAHTAATRQGVHNTVIFANTIQGDHLDVDINSPRRFMMSALSGSIDALLRASAAANAASLDNNSVPLTSSQNAVALTGASARVEGSEVTPSASTRASARVDGSEVTPSAATRASARNNHHNENAAASSHNATSTASKMSSARDSSNEGVAKSSHHSSASKITPARNNSNEGMANSSHHASASKMSASRNNSNEGMIKSAYHISASTRVSARDDSNETAASSSHHVSTSALTRASARDELMGDNVGSPRNRLAGGLSRDVGYSSRGMGNSFRNTTDASSSGGNATGSSTINAMERSERLNDDDEDVRGPSPRPYKSRRDYYDGYDSDAGRGDF